ncbi:glutamate--tRNA ligase [soil metagenome]
MNTNSIRVRFAPSPTGLMHLGNVRTALMNYLFAQQKQATFIIRIEDTDLQRNFDPEATKIISDLQWLGLDYQEGPIKGGPHAPYFQSQRTPIYEKYIGQLKDKNKIYRCFCTPEELEKKRERQAALKLPPRYDRTCLKRSVADTQKLLDDKVPFIWRLQLDQSASVTINDLAHGMITFEFKNFSDFPLTRADGTVTFIFANFVDDMVMEISHVIRGEDHLTNTANQAALYELFGIKIPIFWHLPILCNAEGKKLSKRDFGFSLNDLINAGYLPEAIDNYLATIGGGTFDQEIMSLSELAQKINFDHIHSTGHVRYDVEKLRWLNQKWIGKLSPEDLLNRCMPYLLKDYPEAKNLNPATLSALIQTAKTEMHLLADVSELLKFIFVAPVVDATAFNDDQKKVAALVKAHLDSISNPEQFVAQLKTEAKAQSIPLGQLFWFMRMALLGKEHGPAIHELIHMLGTQEAQTRIEKCL